MFAPTALKLIFITLTKKRAVFPVAFHSSTGQAYPFLLRHHIPQTLIYHYQHYKTREGFPPFSGKPRLGIGEVQEKKIRHCNQGRNVPIFLHSSDMGIKFEFWIENMFSRSSIIITSQIKLLEVRKCRKECM